MFQKIRERRYRRAVRMGIAAFNGSDIPECRRHMDRAQRIAKAAMARDCCWVPPGHWAYEEGQRAAA